MKEHFTPCSLDERVDDVDKRAAFKSTDCARSLARSLGHQKAEKNSARDTEQRASECPDSIQKETSQKTCKSRHCNQRTNRLSSVTWTKGLS